MGSKLIGWFDSEFSFLKQFMQKRHRLKVGTLLTYISPNPQFILLPHIFSNVKRCKQK